MSEQLSAPTEGSATTAAEIADELSEACDRLRVIDYNALNPEELDELLGAFQIMQDMCLKYREEQTRPFAGDEDDTDEDTNGRTEPSRSEPADFGGGETTGVQDL